MGTNNEEFSDYLMTVIVFERINHRNWPAVAF